MYKINKREDIDKIIELYEKDRLSTESIGKLFNVSGGTILSILKRNNVIVSSSRSRIPINSDYFKCIDSEDKAYFLGLIGADGSISFCKNKRAFSIELIEEDSYILDELSIKLCGNTSLVKHYSRTGRSNFAKISFGDCVFIDNLMNSGIIRNKSLNYDFPSFIDDNLMSHFIRGYFDGDGSVYRAGDTTKFSFTGSKLFIPKLNNYMFNIGVFNKEYSIIDRGNFCSIHPGGILPSYNFYNYIYNNANYFLHRKKYVFESAPKFRDELRESGKIGEDCDVNTEVRIVEDNPTVEHSE